jgi:hypothetical protein
MLTGSYPQEDLTKLCSPLPLEKEDQPRVSFEDSDLSTEHSAQLLANKNLTLKRTVVIITSEMYLANRRMPVNGQKISVCVKER